jgi:hypothetical protein
VIFAVVVWSCLLSVGLPEMAHPNPSTCPEDMERKQGTFFFRIRMAQGTATWYLYRCVYIFPRSSREGMQGVGAEV